MKWPLNLARWLGYRSNEGSLVFDLGILLAGWTAAILGAWLLLRKK
jgi:hypothetical protein